MVGPQHRGILEEQLGDAPRRFGTALGIAFLTISSVPGSASVAVVIQLVKHSSPRPR